VRAAGGGTRSAAMSRASRGRSVRPRIAIALNVRDALDLTSLASGAS
jgi:hypothetical protein